MELRRSAGILLHPTSLPGGRLGEDAVRFVDWLAAAGQAWWQMLPLGPPDELGSPYAASSAFAAWEGLLARPQARVSKDELAAFRDRHTYWAADWERFGGDLRHQVRFEREWAELRRYAAELGVRLIGDVPIYVAEASADHLAHPRLFLDGVVAGAPPDDYTAAGQHWGNPLWDWDALAATGYRFWVERLRRTFELFDVTRIDHFRGFEAFWAIPAETTDARRGAWRPGPGRAVFDAATRVLGELPVIAEDLGHITPDVERLRDELGFPGMAVMIWAFVGEPDSPHRLENHREHAVVYTSVHDTDTVAGTFGGERDPWDVIRAAYSSRARLAVVPAQDVLGLGTAARTNIPGELHGNWLWRLEPGQLTEELAARLRAETETAGRVITAD